MTRKGVKVALGILLGVLVIAAFYFMCNVQRQIRFSTPGNHSAMYFLQNGMIEIDSLLMFNLDSGSSISTITQEDLSLLRDMGMKVDSVWFPAIGYDTYENLRFTTKRYKVSLPAYTKRVKIDSATRSLTLVRVPDDSTTIDNIMFFPSRPGEVSTIGMDALERFSIETLTPSGILSIRNFIPEGYQEVVPLKGHPSLKTLLGIECRYFVPMVIDGEPHEFFVNSGINQMNVKVPLEDTASTNTSLSPSLIIQHQQVVPVKVGVGWIQIGTRAGEREVTYSPLNDNMEQYSINPANIFESDVIFDYPNKKVYMRPNTSTQLPLI